MHESFWLLNPILRTTLSQFHLVPFCSSMGHIFLVSFFCISCNILLKTGHLGNKVILHSNFTFSVFFVLCSVIYLDLNYGFYLPCGVYLLVSLLRFFILTFIV